jgi:hypothetical protein
MSERTTAMSLKGEGGKKKLLEDVKVTMIYKSKKWLALTPSYDPFPRSPW